MKLITIPSAVTFFLLVGSALAGEPAKSSNSAKAAAAAKQVVAGAVGGVAPTTCADSNSNPNSRSTAATATALGAALCGQVASKLTDYVSGNATGNASGSAIGQAMGNQAKAQLGQAASNQAAAQLGKSFGNQSDSQDNSLSSQVKGQAAQILGSQISARIAPAAAGQAPQALGKQLQDQAAQTAGGLAASQASNLFAPIANGLAGKGQGLGAQVGAQVGSQLSQQLGARLSQSLGGTGAAATPSMPDLRSGLSQSAADAAAAPVARQLGALMQGTFAPGAARMQQGVQQGLSAELQKRMGVVGTQAAPGLQSSLQSAATDAASASLSQVLRTEKQPLVGDLLTLGLKSQLPADKTALGGFAAPIDSALPIGTDGLRPGLSILSNSNGKAAFGMKSTMEVGSQKVEISGSVDPNSNAEQGKSAGVQIKIGGK